MNEQLCRQKPIKTQTSPKLCIKNRITLEMYWVKCKLNEKYECRSCTSVQNQEINVSLTITVGKRQHLCFHFHTLLLSVLSGIFWPQPGVHMFARGQQSPTVGRRYAPSLTPQALMSISFSNQIHNPSLQQSHTPLIKSRSLQKHPHTCRSVHVCTKIYHTWPFALPFYCYEVVPLHMMPF